MDITLIRGDTCLISFNIKDAYGQNYELKEGDRLYFTVKKSFYTEEVVFQKTYENGISYNSATNEYLIEITQDTTAELPFGQNVYDIKIVISQEGEDPIVKTLIKGTFTLTPNATYKENE